jgi:hypothetical protein
MIDAALPQLRPMRIGELLDQANLQRPPAFALRTPADSSTPASDLPVEKLTDQDLSLVRQYFSRRLGIVREETLAAQILARPYQRMEIQDRLDDPKSAATALAEILAEIHGRESGSPK